MKKIVIFCLLFLSVSCSSLKKDTLYQISTIDSLLAAVYDSNFDDLSQYGDFGIGTFNKLDGELIMLDGVIYQVKDSGRIEVKDSKTKTPFVNLNFFNADYELNLEANDFNSLQVLLKKSIEQNSGTNFPFAIKIQGDFAKLKLRSVPAQSRPYAELKDIVAKQSIFNYSNISGTMLGYWMPEYFKGLSVPAFHFHFISDDRTKGGHVLALEGLSSAQVELDELHNFKMLLPEDSADFRQANTSKDRSEELKKVEK